MDRWFKWCFYLAAALLPVACWQRDTLVEQHIVPALGAEPVQTRTREEAFSVRHNGVSYRVEPLYDYELHGLVVSYRHHDGDRMLHRLWNDHLNVADVCVVWGDNLAAVDLKAFEFWNGQFTCFFRTRDSNAWRRFDKTEISNNHLITDDGYLRDRIASVRVGDQIRVAGWLASYGNDAGFSRGTSVTRTDEGNGACETIYVTRFDVLSSMDSGWRTLYSVCAWGAGASAFAWLFVVMRGPASNRRG